jgi:hypothetical protein
MISEVIEVQRYVNKKIQSNVIEQEPQNILPYIYEYDPELISFALGDFGNKLYSLCSLLDREHIQAESILGGIFHKDSDFSHTVIESLELAKIAQEKNMTRIIPHIFNVAVKNVLPKDVIKKINNPVFNHLHIRLLKNQEDRKIARNGKIPMDVDLRLLFKKGKSWDSYGDSFKPYMYGEDVCEDEIEKAKEKAFRFKELGCNELSDQIIKDIESFKERQKQYCGFNRITMTDSVIILAKAMGCMLDPSLKSIKVPFGVFDKFDPDTNPFTEEKVASFGYALPKNSFVYKPRVYPLDLFGHNLPKTINYLENFPLVGCKPIFDNFWVVVPTIDFPKKANGKWCFLDDNGESKAFMSYDKAKLEFDLMLVKNGYLNPILLGEKDGKSYFITYWN